MSELAEYEVDLNGNTMTMQLTAEAAERMGGRKIGAVQAVDAADGDNTTILHPGGATPAEAEARQQELIDQANQVDAERVKAAEARTKRGRPSNKSAA